MNRLWKWLEVNSLQLQGLAAVAVLLATLAGVPYLTSIWLKPDLTIKIVADSPTVPPSLEKWISEATLMLKRLPDAPKGDIDPYRWLRGLQTTGPLDPIRRESWRLAEPSRLQVDVVNDADRLIQGVRLRLDRAYPVWGLKLGASFLTAAEVSVWQKGLSADNAGPTLILPELPPIPPKSAVTITAYGDVANAEVSATVPGASFKLVPTVRLEDKGPVSLILRPHWLPLLVGLAALAIIAGLAMFEHLILRHARRTIPYNLACSEAKMGRKESALALLQEAINAGYRNFQHMRSDPDLEELRENDTFKKLVGL